MKAKTKKARRKTSSYRMTQEAKALILEMSVAGGVSQAAIVELAIRAYARIQGYSHEARP